MTVEDLPVVITPRTGRLRLALWRATSTARFARTPLHPERHRHVLVELGRHPDVLDVIADHAQEGATE